MKSINLALQGGGSHGAFTWGALDAVLADGRVAIEGISGTSAGAVNAVALAHGWASAGSDADRRAGARKAMTRIWNEITALGSLGSLQASWSNLLWGGLPKELAPTNIFATAISGLASPYQTNPLNLNPLRDLLKREIDFDAIARLKDLKVFVSATHVATGKAEIFSGRRLSLDAVLASTCLPMLFQAVRIDGQDYWDGGYSGNPAMTPLISHCSSADLVLVQINPIQREKSPQTPTDIMDRVNELTFNASLLAQMRTIDFINRLLDSGRLDAARYKQVLLHRIDGGEALERYPASSKQSTDGTLIRELFELGHASAQRFLKSRFDDLGVRSTVNIRRDYLDDMRMGGVEP